MLLLLRVLIRSLATVLSSRSALIAENFALRHQLGVFQRTSQRKPLITSWDRALWAFGLRRWRGWKDASVTRHPAARWLGQQIINAFPWNTEPRFLI